MSTWRGTGVRDVRQRTEQELVVEADTREEAEAKLLALANTLTDAQWSRGWATLLEIEDVYEEED